MVEACQVCQMHSSPSAKTGVSLSGPACAASPPLPLYVTWTTHISALTTSATCHPLAICVGNSHHSAEWKQTERQFGMLSSAKVLSSCASLVRPTEGRCTDNDHKHTNTNLLAAEKLMTEATRRQSTIMIMEIILSILIVKTNDSDSDLDKRRPVG